MLNANGFEIKTFPVILQEVQDELTEIFGEVDFSSSTPAGNFAQNQAKIRFDMQMQLLALYNNLSFDAEGRQLDRIVNLAIGLPRNGASKTIVNLDITTDRQTTLTGGVYTVADTQGNRYILQNTATINAGTNTLTFEAEEFGEIQPILNTITRPATIVLGVISITNSTAPLQIGVDVETDFLYRERANSSRAINASGGIDALFSNLSNIEGVTDVKVYHNRTNIVQNTIPAHSIWAIIEGGDNQEIVNTIASKNSFAGMKGSVIGTYTTLQGSEIEIRFDRPVLIDLYIRGNIQIRNSINEVAIKEYLVNNVQYSIGEYAESSHFVAKIREYLINNNLQATPFDFEISRDNVNFVNILEVSSFDEKFTLNTNSITFTQTS